VILPNFLKIAMLRVVLDKQKIHKTVLEKAVFFILWHFYFFYIFLSKNLINGPPERRFFFLLKKVKLVSKIENFMLI
jgi:hypothetical protein